MGWFGPRTFGSRAASWSLTMVLGCAPQTVPDPKLAVDEFSKALAQGDADALYAMMSSASQQYHGKGRVRSLALENRRELAQLGRGLASGRYDVEIDAEVRFEKGVTAALTVEDGIYRVQAIGLVPARAQSPLAALRDFRAALQRRSYAPLLRVLSRDTGASLDSDLQSLAQALAEPDTLDLQVVDDTATVSTPGGHWVELKREGDVWRVHDFH